MPNHITGFPVPHVAHTNVRAQVLSIPELLANILNHCDRKDLATAGAVCSTWSAVVGAFTHFGALVIYHPNSKASDMAFSRDLSRGGRRRVVACLSQINSAHRPSIVKDLLLHSTRITRLVVCQLSLKDMHYIWLAVRQGMPILEELLLCNASSCGDNSDKGCNPSSFTLDALICAAPQLKRLVCSGIVIGGPYHAARAIDSIEFASPSPSGCGVALSLWLAPWSLGETVTGVAIREACPNGQFESWVATAWVGDWRRTNLQESTLDGTEIQSHVVRQKQGPYRRIVVHEALPALAFSFDGITAISMPLYFWGLVRDTAGKVRLPNLVLMHLRMIEMYDHAHDRDVHESLVCPRLRRVGLEVEKVGGIKADDRPWDHYIFCSPQDIATLVEGIVRVPGGVAVDLLGGGFAVSGQSHQGSMPVYMLRTIHSFQAWLSIM